MGDKRVSEFFSIIVNVLAEIEHDGHPDIVRGDFHISMVDIGFIKCS